MNKLPLLVISLLSAFILAGCVSYTTLQSAKTLPGGDASLGFGMSYQSSAKDKGVGLQAMGRVGIIDRFDAGAAYIVPGMFFIDGKVELLRSPLTISADLGWSYYSFKTDLLNIRSSNTAWYPTILVGQEHWYVGFKKVYFITSGDFDFFGTGTFRGSGWFSTNVVVGGVLGTKTRLLPELNIVIPPSGKAVLVPAIGVQFGL